MSPRSRSITTGENTCWLGWSIIFCVVFSSNSLFLNFPLTDRSWSVMSGNLTMLLAKSKVTEYFLKKDIPMRMFPIVGRTMNVSSKILPPMKNRKRTCFLTGTMLPLAISTLNSGAGSSSRRAAGWAVRVRRSSASERALWIAPVSSRPKFSYARNWSGTYSILSFLLSWRVALNWRISYFGFFTGFSGLTDAVGVSAFGWSRAVLLEGSWLTLLTSSLGFISFGLMV